MPEDESAPPTPHSASSSASSTKLSFSPTTTSFVYPVRSLLSAIQPAASLPRSRSTDTVSFLARREDSSQDIRQLLFSPHTAPDSPEHVLPAAVSAEEDDDKLREHADLTFADRMAQTSEHPEKPSGLSQLRRRTLSTSRVPSRSSLSPGPPSSYHIPPTSHHRPQEIADISQYDKPRLSGKMTSSLNFRHFPAEEGDPNVPRTFSSVPVELASSSSASLVFDPEIQMEASDLNAIPLPLVASPALAATSVSLLPSAMAPPLSVSPTNSLSPPEKNPSLAAVAEEMEHPIHVKDFAQGTVGSSSHPREHRADSPSLAQRDILESYLSADVGLATWPAPSGNSPTSEAADEVPDLPYNLSQYGLVHLPPLPSPAHTDYGCSRSSLSSKQASITRSGGHTHQPGSVSSGQSQSMEGGSESSKYYSAASPEPLLHTTLEVTPYETRGSPSREGEDDLGPASGSGVASKQVQPDVPLPTGDVGSDASSAWNSKEDAGSSAEGSSSGDEYVSFRFQYAMDENGHHVVVGREGKLQRCEDEPIRTPGAVQGFGVLIALEDTEETLVVRQVSENSTEILGLSPRYLFSLECFTDTLPESSAGILWDNIQFLIDTTYPVPEDEDSGPHVFVISGWGEPGSQLAQEVDDGSSSSSSASSLSESRRYWTCWCAAHRAQRADESKPGLIVLEFELELDTFNPLYPPISAFSLIPPENVSQGSGSTSTLVSSPGFSTPESASTVVSEESGHSSHPSHPPPSLSSQDSETPSASTNLHPTPAQPQTWSQYTPHSLFGLEGDDDWKPSAEDILASTTNFAKPLPALERLRRLTQRGPSPYGPTLTTSPSISSESFIPSARPTSPKRVRNARRGTASSGSVGMMDVFAVMAQINEQLGAASDLDTFLKVTVGVIKDLTQFHRVLVYQFDEAWNGQTVAELVDWGVTRDLYRGLHFPASDIPRQARELYMINKVRVLYDRSQPTARIVARDKTDLEEPLNMTHCYLRAMSPIHLKYLENMGVRASMSVSIMAFDQLWGLVACHSYGNAGMRVSFPVRQMLRLLSQSISRNIERLSYAQRLHTRKLINTLSSDRHPTGYIVSNADDLLGLFDADSGILVIGEGAKILGPNQHGQEILIMAEYLRLKQFDTIQASQAVINDFPDLRLTTGFEVIAGLLYVPLSSGGKDFIAFLRRGQLRDVHWAGKPFKNSPQGSQASLEPRRSFKIWSETVAGRCRAWTDEQLETAGVLALVYGKFIEVWRQKQNALQTTKLTNLLLSNATHEVRTPLNHIINYLEMAMNGTLDNETRDNLVRSHVASKSLLFTINDLLDLTRLESGNETSFNEPFDLHAAILDAVHIYRKEASRRNLDFVVDVSESPQTVVGDSRKIKTVVQNLSANALKYTESGAISVSCKPFEEPEGLRSPKQTAVEIVVADTGCGIEEEKLEKIFREFEQVESSEPRSNAEAGVGLGLAVVARIVEQLGGQLRVDSKVDSGSRFSFLIPLALTLDGSEPAHSIKSSTSSVRSRPSSVLPARTTEIDGLVEAIGTSHMSSRISPQCDTPHPPADTGPLSPRIMPGGAVGGGRGAYEIKGSGVPIRPVKVDYFDQEVARATGNPQTASPRVQTPAVEAPRGLPTAAPGRPRLHRRESRGTAVEKLRILIVEDNDINRAILAKRLTLTGHTVVNAMNGQEGIDAVISDHSFDLVLMDIQMPIVNGFEATRRIRELEGDSTVRIQLDRTSHKFNRRIPIFAVSASLMEQQREELIGYGMDGWILKPIDFKRLNALLKGITDTEQRKRDIYRVGGSWEAGGWLEDRLDD